MPSGKPHSEPVAASSAPDVAVPQVPASNAPREPVFAGCARIRERCQCFDTAGAPVEKEKLFCEDATRVAVGVGKALEIISDANPYRDQLERQRWADDDREVLAFMGRREDAKRAKER